MLLPTQQELQFHRKVVPVQVALAAGALYLGVAACKQKATGLQTRKMGLQTEADWAQIKMQTR